MRTGRARSKIRHYLKTMEQEESQDLGEKMLAQALRAEGLQLPDESEAHAALWQQITRWSGNRSRAELLTDIGLGRKIAIIVAKRLAHMLLERGQAKEALAELLGADVRGSGPQSDLCPDGQCRAAPAGAAPRPSPTPARSRRW